MNDVAVGMAVEGRTICDVKPPLNYNRKYVYGTVGLFDVAFAR